MDRQNPLIRDPFVVSDSRGYHPIRKLSMSEVRQRRSSLGNATGSTLVRIPRCPDIHRENEVGISDLSPEDLRTIALIAAGYSNRNIARQFSLSESSVYRHVARISDKLDVSNRLELVLFAISSKLL